MEGTCLFHKMFDGTESFAFYGLKFAIDKMVADDPKHLVARDLEVERDAELEVWKPVGYRWNSITCSWLSPVDLEDAASENEAVTLMEHGLRGA